MEHEFLVNMEVLGSYVVECQAECYEDAKAKAIQTWQEADFGVMTDINMEIIRAGHAGDTYAFDMVVEGGYTVTVMAHDNESANEKALLAFNEADFGELSDVECRIIATEAVAPEGTKTTPLGRFHIDVSVKDDGTLDAFFAHDGVMMERFSGISVYDAGAITAHLINFVKNCRDTNRSTQPKELQSIRAELPAKNGKWVVDTNYDPNHPGLDVEFVPDNPAFDEKGLTKPRVLLEEPNDEHFGHVYVWGNRETEDYTFECPLNNFSE